MRKAFLIPVSLVIPTVGRRERLIGTLVSVANQALVPAEICIVDGSDELFEVEELKQLLDDAFSSEVRFMVMPATIRGAGAQRNQAVELSSQPFIWFLDDDVDLEPGCLSALWRAMEGNERLGGCNSIITNQRYSPPGRIMRKFLSWIGCPSSGSLAGLCQGPAMNFLPTDDVKFKGERTQWMNTTCTLYRRAALPDPSFLHYFHGYSLMEDLALSLEVRKRWELQSVTSARIFHDTGLASYKSRVLSRQVMEVANRWFVGRRVMNCAPVQLFFRLLLIQMIGLMALLRAPNRWVSIPAWLIGNSLGWWRILRHGRSWKGY